MKLTGFFLVASFFVATILFAQSTTQVLQIGDPAPAIQVRKWIKGSPVKEFEKGKVYVVEFWATWCAPCIAGMPHLSKLAQQYKDKVVISGISVLERKNTSDARVDAFVDSMGNKMDYHVAAEDSNYMAENWLKASGERGIPFAYVIDKEGRIAWMGHPNKLDHVLAKVVNGSWDVAEASAERKGLKRIAAIDNSIAWERLNKFMGNPGKSDSALLEIQLMTKEEPKLKYAPRVGHYTFWSLIKTDPAKAAVYGRELMRAVSYEDPPYKSITDAVSYMVENRKVELPKETYEVGAEAYQAQIDNYPWSMDIPNTYANIAKLYALAKNRNKAIEAQKRAIESARSGGRLTQAQLTELVVKLEQYMKI